MIIWIFTLIFDIIFNIIAYITNPIVCLFVDEYGRLPKVFYWWSQHDDGMDIDWMIYEGHVADWMKYDFNKHYIYHGEGKLIDGVMCSYVELIDPNFTIKERIQRYFCRLTWMYRNCAYGFSYSVTGRVIDGDKVIDLVPPYTIQGQKVTVRYYENWKTFGPFCVYGMIKWNPKNINWLKWTGIDRNCLLKIFLGYKFQSIKKGEKYRCMLVCNVHPFRVIYPKGK